MEINENGIREEITQGHHDGVFIVIGQDILPENAGRNKETTGKVVGDKTRTVGKTVDHKTMTAGETVDHRTQKVGKIVDHQARRIIKGP